MRQSVVFANNSEKIKLWTFQTNERVSVLLDGNTLKPDWNKQKQIAGCSKAAYNYILQKYKDSTDILCNGLIFGHVDISTQGGPNLKTITDLYSAICNAGEPSGSKFSFDTHTLLELELPAEIPVMIIDFYRFSDLLFLFEERMDNSYTLADAKKYLFKPNLEKYELPTSHIPYINPDWIVKTYNRQL